MSGSRGEAWWRERVRLPKLPADFDPAAASPFELADHLMPAAPDPVEEALLHAHWQEMMAPPLRFMTADLARDLGLSEYSGGLGLPLGGSRIGTSRNWSGAVILPHDGVRFSKLSGRWVVPRLTPRPQPAESALAPECAVWIGFGGYRRWSRAMPQLGTTHRQALGAEPESHRAWIQWWIRGDDASGPLLLNHPKVQPGDIVLAFLTLVTPHFATFFLKNKNTGVAVAFALDMSGVEGAAAEGVSAQWIVERPRDPGSKQMHPMADFGHVRFRHCAASAGGVQHATSPGWRLRMVERVGADDRAHVVAAPAPEEAAGVLTLDYRAP